MQLGTTDGRLKLIGAASTEVTLTSEARTYTASIHILPNTGDVIRLDDDGRIELWSMDSMECVASLPPPHDDVVTVCLPLPHDPYLLLGCRSGAVNVVGLLGSDHAPLGPTRSAHFLSQMPYVIEPRRLGIEEEAPIVDMRVMESQVEGTNIVMLHEWQAVTVFNLDSSSVRH